MGSPIIHIEMPAHNHTRLAGWYARHFGWKTQEWPEVGYTTATWADNMPGVGFGNETPERPIGMILCYIHTEDIDGSIAAISADGATLVGEKMNVPTVGDMVWFKDPDGNPMALLQPEMPPEE